MDNHKIPITEEMDSSVFTPDNEPYLGRQSVYHFDLIIQSCLAANRQIAPYTHTAQELSDLQIAASQIVPQGINLALSIRELVRQGYLFAAAVLMRSLIERAITISYLYKEPDKIELWKNGWKYRERPNLSSMMASVGGKLNDSQARDVCSLFNHITHGDPIGSAYNLIKLNGIAVGYSVGKNLSDPELCDFVCLQAYCYLITLMGIMVGCFPEAGIKPLEDPQGMA